MCGEVGSTVNSELLEKIRELATSEDWREREEAAAMIKKLNDSHFEEYLQVWRRWISDSNPSVRRAALVGLVRLRKEHVGDALELLQPLLRDRHPYVRRNLGPFVLSRLCGKAPGRALEKLREWMRDEDEVVRWNVASCLGGWYGVNHPEVALQLLEILARDERRFVWRAAAASLVKLLRRHPELRREVLSWQGCERAKEVVRRYVNLEER